MRIAGCLLILGLTASLASAQSLAELARKEKERRKSNDGTTGVVEVYSDEDLDGDDRDSAEPPQTEPPPGAEPEEDSGLDDWLEKKEAERADWSDRLVRYQERYTEQKARLAQLAAIKTECDRDAAPVPTMEVYVESGSYVTWGFGHATCEALPGMVSEIERTMRAIEVECRADARRHFIPPAEAALH